MTEGDLVSGKNKQTKTKKETKKKSLEGSYLIPCFVFLATVCGHLLLIHVPFLSVWNGLSLGDGFGDDQQSLGTGSCHVRRGDRTHKLYVFFSVYS